MIRFEGCGVVQRFKEVKKYILVNLSDENDTVLNLKVPYSSKKIISINERLIFGGIINEDGIVVTDFVSRAYLEQIGFRFSTNKEDVFSYQKKGDYIKLDVKAPFFEKTYKTFSLLGKFGSDEVLNRILSCIESKKVSLKGFITKNILVMTSIDKPHEV